MFANITTTQKITNLHDHSACFILLQQTNLLFIHVLLGVNFQGFFIVKSMVMAINDVGF